MLRKIKLYIRKGIIILISKLIYLKNNRKVGTYMDKVIAHSKGSIYFANINNGKESVTKACVIVSNNDYNSKSDDLAVAVIEKEENVTNDAFTVPFINWSGEVSLVLCNQIYTINKKSIANRFYGVLSKSTLKEVERQISMFLGIGKTTIELGEVTKAINKLVEVKKKEVELLDRPVEQCIVDKAVDIVNELVGSDVIETKNIVDKAIELEKPENINTEEKDDNKDKVEVDENVYKLKRKPHGFWTQDRITELLNDKENMKTQDILDKWGIKNTQTLSQLCYKFKKDRALK